MISTSTLQENWKSSGTWKSRLYLLEDLVVGRMGRVYPNDSIIENGQNSEKSRG